jgi:hypothetical protein
MLILRPIRMRRRLTSTVENLSIFLRSEGIHRYEYEPSSGGE